MMLLGRIAKQEGPFWSADVETIGAFTQGKSRVEAFDMLASLVRLQVAHEGFDVTIAEVGTDADGATIVRVESKQPALLAAQVLKYQREIHKLTLSDVAKKLGASSLNAYAAYEQGKREPSLSKYLELLAAVAPELALTVEPRSSGVKSKRKASAK